MDKLSITDVDPHMRAGFSLAAGWILEEYQVPRLQIGTIYRNPYAAPLRNRRMGDSLSQLPVNIHSESGAVESGRCGASVDVWDFQIFCHNPQLDCSASHEACPMAAGILKRASSALLNLLKHPLGN